MRVRVGGLVLYKKRPARVLQVAEKISIELPDGNHARVRAKDITPLHPGPLDSLDELITESGEVELAWEILSEAGDESHNLQELAELIYGQFSPSTAWGAWKWLDDGLYFRGSPDAITACRAEEVLAKQRARQEREAKAKAWLDFLTRARQGKIDPVSDKHYLEEVEALALGRRKDSRLLRELGRKERPEGAHAFLLDCGYWDHTMAPYTWRLGLARRPPEEQIPPLPEDERLDLTHLESLAIDDRGNQDPDDAFSLEEFQFDENGRFKSGRVWVHIADVSALVAPDSPADLEARGRGATLYLPDGAVPMLPVKAVETLGLGLQDVSPALSFGLRLEASGEISDVEITPSWVCVRRLSYDEADRHIETDPFRGLYALADAYRSRRQDHGALFIDMPEVIVRVVKGRVVIRPVERLHSREIVREAMLMVGEAAAHFAIQHEIPFPFVTQSPPELGSEPRAGMSDPQTALAIDAEPSLAGFYALRRSLKRSQVSGYPAPHAGVGLPNYSRATSPLRRYLDLVAHQQLRAFFRGAKVLGQEELLQRVGASDAVVGSVNLAESLSRRHWTLVYLEQHPDWQGEAVLLEKRDLRGRVVIPELALEAPLHLSQDLPLDSRLLLKVRGVNLPELEAHFVQV
jgi:exoribonuclease-2